MVLYYPAHPSASTTPGDNTYLTQSMYAVPREQAQGLIHAGQTVSTKPHSQLLSTLPTYFYEATITRMPKPCEENHRPISLMNISAEILNKRLEVQIQEHIKKIIYHDKLALSQRYRDGSGYIINKCNPPYKQTEKTKIFQGYLILSLDIKKAFTESNISSW